MKEKVSCWIRNLTKGTEVEIKLPLNATELLKRIPRTDEYIILECDVLDVGEFESIYSINDFLIDCKEKEINIRELKILSHVFLFNEIVEKVKDKNYIIVDFDEVTKGWYGGSGGDLWNNSHKGMCLFDAKVKDKNGKLKRAYNPFKFYISDDMYDWIDWESVWVNATTEGWNEVSIDYHGYLVCRYDRRENDYMERLVKLYEKKENKRR